MKRGEEAGGARHLGFDVTLATLIGGGYARYSGYSGWHLGLDVTLATLIGGGGARLIDVPPHEVAAVNLRPAVPRAVDEVEDGRHSPLVAALKVC